MSIGWKTRLAWGIACGGLGLLYIFDAPPNWPHQVIAGCLLANWLGGLLDGGKP